MAEASLTDRVGARPASGAVGEGEGAGASGPAAEADEGVARCPLHTPDDRFIPLRASELIEAVLEDEALFGLNGDQRREVFDALHDIVMREATTFEAALADRYAWFNPDRDTLPTGASAQWATEAAADTMIDRLSHLLRKANFERLSAAQVQEAVRAANSQGLKVCVDPERLADFQIWVRGRDQDWHRRRCVRAPVRGLWCEMTVYRRMVVVARLREDREIHVKMFREIPLADVEALLPHASVRMSWLDRIQAFGGAGGALGSTALKAGKVASAVAYWSTLTYLMVGGLAMLACRAFFGYRRAKAKRDHQRTRHLYYRFLAGNAAAIHALVAMVMQEEQKEAVLAYAACDAERLGGEPVGTREALRDLVQRFLHERFGLEVDFDVGDAIETMHRLGMFADEGFPRVKGPAEAEHDLRELFRRRERWGYHERMAAESA